jgi:hypothetical protein
MAQGFYSYTYQFGELSAAFPDGTWFARPCIKVNLRTAGDKETHHFLAIADTGADYCVFPADFADRLGLDYETMPSAPAFGIGSNEEFRFSVVEMEVDQLGIWPVYVAFYRGWDGRNSGLLGHFGFLERFKATFDLSRDAFQLEEKNG